MVRLAVYVPRGCAHGYLTLEDDCEVEYVISTRFEPSAAVGIRWDDPAVGIAWPLDPIVISDRDRMHAPFDPDSLRESRPTE